ncbi:ATP-NAD kinase-like domain-containing protein [Gorgonomyces haynaldii]|nr:ATP-NAD kinase-like domain-containing protein [Gorgonomyces haynaldii]
MLKTTKRLLHWKRPRTVLLLTKESDAQIEQAANKVVGLLEKHKAEIVLESHFKQSRPDVDLVITLGGDGTLMHCSRLFPQQVPPVLSFSLGSLGFLIPFDFKDVRAAVNQIMQGPVPLVHRMRLEAQVNQEKPITFLNDLVVHRGRQAQLTVIDVGVGGQHLTDVVADGLILSTPTGSTAYNLSAGGPIVHPLIQSIIMTPICPRSLSFRPVLLPSELTVDLKLSHRARGHADVSIDGKEVYQFNHSDEMHIKLSPYPVPCVSTDNWLKDIKNTLRWNQNFIHSGVHPSFN